MNKAYVRRATKLSNFVAQLCCSTKLHRQLSVFHRQTIAKQASFLVTQTTTLLSVVSGVDLW